MIELERACKLMCYLCGEGKPVAFDDVTGRYYHQDEYGYFYNAGWCRADALRKTEASE